MKVRLKRAEADRLAYHFLKNVSDVEKYLLKGVKASKEFKKFVEDYISVSGIPMIPEIVAYMAENKEAEAETS